MEKDAYENQGGSPYFKGIFRICGQHVCKACEDVARHFFGHYYDSFGLPSFHGQGGRSGEAFITAFILAALYILSGAVLGTAYKKSGLADTRCAYSLDEGGMDIKMGDLSGDLSWSYVKYVKETKNLFIIRAKGSQFIIPKRCLKSAEFREFIKNTLPEEKIKRLKYTIDKETEDNGD